VAYKSCKDSSETQVLRSSVSAIGLMAVLIPIPTCAMRSVSARSLLAVPGNISRAYFIAFPGKVSNIDPFRAPPVHDKRADVILLVHN
jgi:hypothetical protein